MRVRYAITVPSASQDSQLTILLLGLYYNLATSLCTTCPVGMYCPANSGIAYPCATGYYTTTTGSSSCQSCTAGSSCGNPASSPVPCTAGYYSPAASAYCLPCPSGYYTASTTSSACTVCPSNSMCSDPAVAPVACAAGLYSPQGAVSCTSCPVGEWKLIQKTPIGLD